MEHLFVYGTLRRHTESAIARLLARHAECLGSAVFRGRLFRVRDYPGAVDSGDSSDAVHGELYRVREPERLWPDLDAYEGCGPGDAQSTEFVRQKRLVGLRGGSTMEAWIYLYNADTRGLEEIPSGDFLRRELE